MDDAIQPPEAMIHQADRLQTLNEIGRVVSATLDLNTLYETIYEQVGRVMDTTHFFIALYDERRHVVDVPYLREEGVLYRDQIINAGDSVTYLVIERGTPLLFRNDEEYQEYAAANGLVVGVVGVKETDAKIFVPLSTGSRTIGAMTVQSSRVNAYTQDDVATLSVIASQAAVAIVNAALYRQSQDNVRQMQALLHVARAVNSSLDLESVLDAILSGMRDVVPYYIAAIMLPDPTHDILEVAAAGGPLAEERRRVIKIPFGHGVTGLAFQKGEPIIVPNVREFSGYVPGDLSVRSELAMPLKRGDQVIGVLDVERAEVDAFSGDDLNLLSLFASQAAIAIENARLFAAQERRVTELHAIQAIVQRLTPLHEIPAIAAVIDTELKRLIDYHLCVMF
ncbi:MAG TPA: GAF domain-containing protein, partial [Chloroflexota bacterium]|nr:GAF domain-containing protein [Chloroflexota bacterium]